MQHLIQKRQEIEKLRTSSSISTVQAEQLGKSIASSWQRSNSAEIPKDRFAAPISERNCFTKCFTIQRCNML